MRYPGHINFVMNVQKLAESIKKMNTKRILRWEWALHIVLNLASAKFQEGYY